MIEKLNIEKNPQTGLILAGDPENERLYDQA